MNENEEESNKLKQVEGSQEQRSAVVVLPVKRHLSLWGGSLQVIFILFFGFFARYYYGEQEFVFRFTLFSFFHVLLFLFCVFARSFWMKLATAVACLLTVVVDASFLWYLWGAPETYLDNWKVSLWLVLKLLPLLTLTFLSFWLLSLAKLKKQEVKSHA